MQRRELLKAMAAAGLLPTAGMISSKAAAADPYTGPVYLVVHASGGWDATSLCDPKDGTIVRRNTTTPVPINNWSATENVQTLANNIQYAPFAKNARLFTDHGDKMLVINGLDTQTNSHSAGVQHVYSGRFADGYPAITALAAAKHGAGLPLAFLSNGGYRETAGLTSFTLMQNPSTLDRLINVNDPSGNSTQYHRPESLDLMSQYKQARVDRLQARADLTARIRTAANFLETSNAGRSQLALLNQFSADAEAPRDDEDGNRLSMLSQVQLFLFSAGAGLTVAGDVRLGGFDTHDMHDERQGRALGQLQQGIDYLWQEAARLDADHGTNLVNRLRVVISSDFSRTPWYNDGQGKDHWSVSSAILMQNGGFTHSVVGKTSPTHDALKLNTDFTEGDQTDESLAVTIKPADFQKMLRVWSDTTNYDAAFPLDSQLDLSQFLS